MEGLIAKEWIGIQTTYINRVQNKQNPARWAKELIKKLWMMSWDMWESRNGEVHRNSIVRKEIIITQLNKEVRDTHAMGRTNNFLPRIERQLFKEPVENIIQKSEYQKRTWLTIARKYIERDRKRVVKNRSARLMREWLQPGSTASIQNRPKRNTRKTWLETSSNSHSSARH